jgi:CheY-like chemotaxis protein
MVHLTVVNDNPEILDLMGEILEGDRYVTTLLESVQDDLLRRICQSEPDLLVIDLRHGDDDRRGWEIVQELRTTPGCERLPVVLCSADIPALNEVEAELKAVPDIVTLELPFEVDGVLHSIRTLIGRRETSQCS